MKNISILFIVIFLFAGCRKDFIVCFEPKEIKDTHHLIDISSLKNYPDFHQIIQDNPQLQVTSIIKDSFAYIINCNVFYKGFKIHHANYQLTKGIKHPGTFISGNLNFNFLTLNLQPQFPITKAIEIAKKRFGKFSTPQCPNYYQLCIGYKNEGNSNELDPNNYKLIWVFGSNENLNNLSIDANTGEVDYEFDGVYY